jgi:hypothetical protein
VENISAFSEERPRLSRTGAARKSWRGVHAGPAVRASDAEREQTIALPQDNFADGRLTQAELEERAGAAYAAQTRAQLRDLTADLTPGLQQPSRSGMVLDQRLLVILLCVHPRRHLSTGCYAAASDQPPPAPRPAAAAPP